VFSEPATVASTVPTMIGMDAPYFPTPRGPPGASALTARAIAAALQPAISVGDAGLREEFEIWVNEGGAGDEPEP
jgi:hypothetical protein